MAAKLGTLAAREMSRGAHRLRHPSVRWGFGRRLSQERRLNLDEPCAAPAGAWAGPDSPKARRPLSLASRANALVVHGSGLTGAGSPGTTRIFFIHRLDRRSNRRYSESCARALANRSQIARKSLANRSQRRAGGESLMRNGGDYQDRFCEGVTKMKRRVRLALVVVACATLVGVFVRSGKANTWLCFCPSGVQNCIPLETCSCGSCTGDDCDAQRRVFSYDFYSNGSSATGETLDYVTVPCYQVRACQRPRPNEPCSPSNLCVPSGSWITITETSEPIPNGSCYNPC